MLLRCCYNSIDVIAYGLIQDRYNVFDPVDYGLIQDKYYVVDTDTAEIVYSEEDAEGCEFLNKYKKFSLFKRAMEVEIEKGNNGVLLTSKNGNSLRLYYEEGFYYFNYNGRTYGIVTPSSNCVRRDIKFTVDLIHNHGDCVEMMFVANSESSFKGINMIFGVLIDKETLKPRSLLVSDKDAHVDGIIRHIEHSEIYEKHKDIIYCVTDDFGSEINYIDSIDLSTYECKADTPKGVIIADIRRVPVLYLNNGLLKIEHDRINRYTITNGSICYEFTTDIQGVGLNRERIYFESWFTSHVHIIGMSMDDDYYRIQFALKGVPQLCVANNQSITLYLDKETLDVCYISSGKDFSLNQSCKYDKEIKKGRLML